MTNLILASLATWQIVEIWHHSSIMAGARARVETWSNSIADLLGCPFCLSVWVALGSTAVLHLDAPAGTIWAALVGLLKLPIWAFAVSRVANLGNDLTRKYCRTPKPSSFIDEDNTL